MKDFGDFNTVVECFKQNKKILKNYNYYFSRNYL